MEWTLLERKKRLKAGQEMSKEGLLRLSGRDREQKVEENISKVVKESTGVTLCSPSSPPQGREREGWGKGDWGDWIYRSMEETAIMRVRKELRDF